MATSPRAGPIRGAREAPPARVRVAGGRAGAARAARRQHRTVVSSEARANVRAMRGASTELASRIWRCSNTRRTTATSSSGSMYRPSSARSATTDRPATSARPRSPSRCAASKGWCATAGGCGWIVGCTLDEAEVAAIEKGEALRDAVDAHLAARPLDPPDDAGTRSAGAARLDDRARLSRREGRRTVRRESPPDERRRNLPREGRASSRTRRKSDRLQRLDQRDRRWVERNWESFNVFTELDAAPPTHAASRRRTSPSSGQPGEACAHARRAGGRRARTCCDSCRIRTCPPGWRRSTTGERRELGDASAPTPMPIDRAGLPPRRQTDLRRETWRLHPPSHRRCPNGGERVGEATCAVSPGRIRSGRSIDCTLAVPAPADRRRGRARQDDPGGDAAPPDVARRPGATHLSSRRPRCAQWQLELREKFNLNWPIYDDGYSAGVRRLRCAAVEREVVAA